jgi:hypothetical protein
MNRLVDGWLVKIGQQFDQLLEPGSSASSSDTFKFGAPPLLHCGRQHKPTNGNGIETMLAARASRLDLIKYYARAAPHTLVDKAGGIAGGEPEWKHSLKKELMDQLSADPRVWKVQCASQQRELFSKFKHS